jgi:hypothetical protein
MDDARTALADLAERIPATNPDYRVRAVEGTQHELLATTSNELSVRISARAADEIWVIAGTAMLLRLIADSEGGFDDLADIVIAVLEGRAREVLVAHDGTLIAAGWQLTLASGAEYAGGISETNGDAVVAIRGHFASLR